MSRSLRESSLLNTTDYRSLSVGVVPSNEYLIQTTVVGATPAASIEFDVSAYAGIYRHLKIVASLRSTAGSPTRVGVIRFGTGGSIDSGSNYSGHTLSGSGSTPISSGYASVTEIETRNTVDYGTNSFGAWVMDILDPFETTKYTTIRLLEGSTENPFISLTSGLWQNTGAVSNIQIGVGATFNLNFATGSRFSIYGVTA